jgi:Cu-Zn family superoxide dismutase
MPTTTRALLLASVVTASVIAGPVWAEDVMVDMNAITADGVGEKIGTIRAYDSTNGLVLNLELTGLTAGGHGFHMHENADCRPGEKDGRAAAGLAAGGHFDPHATGKHLGPSGDGHLGDLPVIYVEDSEAGGTITRVEAVPRLKVADLRGHALMIHEGGDNYLDTPEPLGGGGGRIACGAVE